MESIKFAVAALIGYCEGAEILSDLTTPVKEGFIERINKLAALADCDKIKLLESKE